jgi:hypothetical protein
MWRDIPKYDVSVAEPTEVLEIKQGTVGAEARSFSLRPDADPVQLAVYSPPPSFGPNPTNADDRVEVKAPYKAHAVVDTEPPLDLIRVAIVGSFVDKRAHVVAPVISWP